MKRKLFAFCILLLAVGVLSVVVAVMSLLPLPRVLWPVVIPLFYPVVWFWKLLGRRELLPLHAESLSGSVFNLACLVFPCYFIASYLPAFGRWVWRRACGLTRTGLGMP